MEQYCDSKPEFDKKYKIIIRVVDTPEYPGMLDWVNLNSRNSVEIKFNIDDSGRMDSYFAFENSDDALIFKIKYSL